LCSQGGSVCALRSIPYWSTPMSTPARTVVIPASHRDLLEKCQVVILATNDPDGFPQVTATWFLVEPDGAIKASLNTTRWKVKYLQRNPKCTLFFIDPDNPYRTLEIRATAIIMPDDDYSFAARFGAKYNADLRQMDQPGEKRVVVLFQPVKVNTYG
jgi:PPOX class probable F420-dependent enzyme